MDDRPPLGQGSATTDGGDLPPEMRRARQLATALDVDRVAVVLVAHPEHRAVVLGSDPALVAFGDMAVTVGESPGHDVLRTGRPCLVDDLPAAADRWPLLLTTYPVPGPLRSLLVVPVTTARHGTTEDVLGVVVLARDRRRPFTSSEVARAADAAREIARSLLAHAVEREAAALDHDLDDLLDPRADLVPLAVGALSSREGLDRHDALEQLRTRAFRQGSTLQQLARDLLDDRA